MKRLICLAAFLLIAAQAGMADIYFEPQFSTINVGDPIAIDVMISGVTAPWLGGYDIDISYDPAVVHLGAVNWADDFLGTITLRDAVFSPGMVNVAEVSLMDVADLEAAQNGNDPFRLFRLLFTGAAPGVSPLVFERIELADGNADAMAYGASPAGSITVQGGGPVVPEPSTVLLLLAPALGSLILLRRRGRV